MCLRSKISIVLALLIATLITNLSMSMWNIRFLERELSEPLLSMQSIMTRLHLMKRTGEEQTDLILDALAAQSKQGQYDPDRISSVNSTIQELEVDSQTLLNELDSLTGVMLRSGVTTIDNLRDRSAQITEASTTWSALQDPQDAQRLMELIDRRHELIEAIEGQILQDAQLASDFGEEMKSRTNLILLVTLIGALAITLLTIVFIRRSILSPIEELRDGAARFGKGDFTNPISVYTNDELGQLSTEFNQMGIRIQDMQEERIEQGRLAAMGEMTERTVHNFRTPLASIRAFSEVVLEDLEPGSPSRDFQERIIKTVDRFELKLKDMLRASSPLELNLTTYDPAELVESVIEDHQGAAQSKQQCIEFHTGSAIDQSQPLSAIGDPQHLNHAITSILSNAIEFAPYGSTISIDLDANLNQAPAQQSTDPLNPKIPYWTLRIANQGPMIPHDLHRSIFRPYFTTRKSGTGIGLAMSHKVIMQHRGEISVESPLNASESTGCAFTMLIPLNPAT
ncbi:MAG: HAMP domain-containing protein [Phycisphaerales bacterium]|nr:HAMP domain-containing protein [Phycisphaerales bacterium]